MTHIEENAMGDEVSYWRPLCQLAVRLRFWVRLAWRDDDATTTTPWGQGLSLPTGGYIEGPRGPVPIRYLEWVEVSTSKIRGGIAGHPREMLGIEDEILSGLRGTELRWERCQTTWSVERIFDEEPVTVIRVLNPSGPAPVRP
jgi:hypothetical protein